MPTFWDTSAVVPLILQEPATESAGKAWKSDKLRLAWHWMRIESHAALVRRKATAPQLSNWRRLMDIFAWIDLPTAKFGDLLQNNTTWRLRSADAGHLYLFQEVHRQNPEITLVTFDLEMKRQCDEEGWLAWKI